MILVASFSNPKTENRKFPVKDKGAVIGREETADIRLDHPSVSREHARLSVLDGKKHFLIEDLGSANGTFVEGVPLRDRTLLYPDQNLEIGPFRFRVCLMPPVTDTNRSDKIPDTGDLLPEETIVQEAVKALPEMISKTQGWEHGDEKVFAEVAEKLLYRKILELLPPQAGADLAEKLTQKALTISLGFGPLEDWLQDPGISEIMINGTQSVYLEKRGAMVQVPTPFPEEDSIMRVVDRILSPLGRRVDEKTPYADGRLSDGSRINVIIPPASLSGPVVTIRKFSEERLSMERLVSLGSLTREASAFLERAVRGKRSILISGGTGSGKTTLLNALASFIPAQERVITIEDAAELNLDQEHVVRLETRPPSIEGSGEIRTRDLVKNALRMRPDRIIVGECRGGETLDMLQAMNTGHEGSMTTCHANSPRDALKRLEVMTLMAGIDLPLAAIREQIASGIDLIVQISRIPGGQRRVTNIQEIDGLESDQILTQTIFRFCHRGNTLEATGIHPSFLADKASLPLQGPDSGGSS